MQKQEIIDKYKENINFYSEKIKKLKTKNRITSYSRAILFALLIIEIFYNKSINYTVLTFSILLIITFFLFFVKKNIKLKKAIRKNKILSDINKNEILALNNKWHIFHNGKEYINFEHEFSYDLDIFGEASLFQYLNRTSTITGKNNLAKKLTKLCFDKNKIEQKQKAIKELSEKMNWRQNFSASSLANDIFFEKNINSKEDKTLDNILKWSSEKLNFINKEIWKFLLIILPTITFTLLIFAIFNLLPYSFMTLSALINLGIVGSFLKKINAEHSKLGKTTNSIFKIKELIHIVEFSEYNSEYLNTLKNKLTNNNAHEKIKELHKTLNAFDLRLNMIAGVLLNAFLLFDLQILRKLEKQKIYINKNIEKWFSIIGEFDALISLANYSFNNPNYCLPEISEDEFILKIEDGGHPLIDAKKMISNNFSEISLHKISIITGANMAGKSTFLRTIGINMILGKMGAVVCAKKMTFTPIQIFTSVRANDSLQKNESYFYAELMRLKKITDNLKAGNKLFVIIDEMLRGTNSKDKHYGSYELIKQLIKHNTAGLVATHDIQLGKLIEEYPNNISNKRFEVEIINNEVIFDYKIKDGISQNLNASFLMKKYGIIE